MKEHTPVLCLTVMFVATMAALFFARGEYGNGLITVASSIVSGVAGLSVGRNQQRNDTKVDTVNVDTKH